MSNFSTIDAMKLTLEEMVSAVVFGSLLVILIVSLGSRIQHWRAEARLRRVRHVCRGCGNVFAEADTATLSHCPSCDALNFRKGNGKLG